MVQQQQNLGRIFATSKMHLSLQWLRLLSVLRRWFCCCCFVVEYYFHCRVLYFSMFCCALRYIHSIFAIILMGKRELVTLLNLPSWCLVIVMWLFLAVPCVFLQFVIVVFSDHTHLLFLWSFCVWSLFC